MNTITETLAPPWAARVSDDEPLTSGAPSVSPGSLNASAAAMTPTYVDKPTTPSVSAATGIRLSPKQQLMADLAALLGVYLEIFTMSRLAAREQSTFTVMTMMRMVELAAAKMLSAALAQFIGGVVQGVAGIVSGGMQVFSALQSMQTLKSGMVRTQGGLAEAKQDLKLAEAEFRKLKSAPPDDPGKIAAHEKLRDARQNYVDKQQLANAEWKTFTESSEFKGMEADATLWHGMATATKNLGELLESICKYYSSGVEKDKMLIEALEKYLQGAQQNNQEFERDLGEMVRRLLDQLKSKIDSEHQVNMNTAQNV
ncbi:hypothetical protein RAE21_12130 [Rhodoferax sp. TBRC 17198]|uniref:hypothetical protein n=1 Tax=Rhodoferax potami TaxID=3068338 RepID=UPI0028BEEF89|nr:hypothetical protein [Rhodoferax sp. TBRC 17198]MDT7523148.1 hypothetical protein [Rhodoferax sp. TBRC 17198]